jgi:hypothetical protein
MDEVVMGSTQSMANRSSMQVSGSSKPQRLDDAQCLHQRCIEPGCKGGAAFVVVDEHVAAGPLGLQGAIETLDVPVFARDRR